MPYMSVLLFDMYPLWLIDKFYSLVVKHFGCFTDNIFALFHSPQQYLKDKSHKKTGLHYRMFEEKRFVKKYIFVELLL
jgi:hypothetical protein